MGLSKNFSFWTVSLDLDAMFKIKSLLYKDLILNSRGCRKSNQLLRHPRVTLKCDVHASCCPCDFELVALFDNKLIEQGKYTIDLRILTANATFHIRVNASDFRRNAAVLQICLLITIS